MPIDVMYRRHVRAARMVSLLLLLQTRGQTSARELAEHFGVSARTVHRDLQALADAGVPVESARGRAGGYRLAGGYRTRLTGLTREEAETLFLGGVPAAVGELGLGTALATAQLKLMAALPAELRDRAATAGELFHLDASGWFRGEEKTPHLAAIAGALWDRRRIDARYRRGDRVVSRVLDPLGLVLKGGVWYLVARSRRGVRVYRGSRFARVRARDERFERPTDFELAQFWERRTAEFEHGLPQMEVRLRASGAVLRLRCGADLDLEIVDDGPPNGPWRPGVGLHAMRERVAELGGGFDAGPSPAGGRVHVRLPLVVP